MGERLGRTVDAVEEYPEANIRTAEASEIVVLAISPDRVPSVLNDISSSLRPNALVISMTARVTLERLTTLLPPSVTVVRVILNLGGQVGFGVTGVGENESISGEQLRVVHALFATVGKVVAVRDDQLDTVSSLSGTGPAYFSYFTEQFRAAELNWDVHRNRHGSWPNRPLWERRQFASGRESAGRDWAGSKMVGHPPGYPR